MSITMLIVLCAIGAAIYYYIETQTTKDVRATTMPAAQVIRQAVQEIGAQRRWTATGHSSDFASFTYKRHASCFWALVLSLFFLLPGIVYMLLGQKTASLTVSVFPEPNGMSSVQISASGGTAKARGKRFLRALPTAAAMTPQQAHALTESVPGAAVLPAPEPLSQTTAVNAPATEVAASLPEHTAEERTTDTTQLPAGDTSVADDAPTATNLLYCEFCGEEMRTGHRFCPACGKQPTEAV